MVVGFNHNFRYKGQIYHIQTEDSGLKSPNIVTLLYRGGTILASKKTSYADITKIDQLEQVVEELMKDQHREMLRGLKAGDFDAVIARYEAGCKTLAGATPAPPTSPDSAAGRPGAPERLPAVAESVREPRRPAPGDPESLDEVVLSYLVRDENPQKR